MLITLTKLIDRVVPDGDDSYAIFNKMKIGEKISFPYNEKKQRNLGYHRFYFAMLKAVLQNQEHYKTIDNLHEVVKFRSGYYQTIIPLKGEPLIVTKSLSFDKMDKQAFDEFMKEAKNVCVELVGDDALEEIIRFL